MPRSAEGLLLPLPRKSKSSKAMYSIIWQGDAETYVSVCYHSYSNKIKPFVQFGV